MFEVEHREDNADKGDYWCVRWMGDRILTGSLAGHLQIWSIRDSLSVTYECEASIIGVVSVDSTIDNVGLTSSMDSRLKIWNLESGEVKQIIDCSPVSNWQAALSPNGEQAATTGFGGKVTLWDINNGTKLQTLDTTSVFTTAIAYSPSGDKIACGGKEGILTLFNTSSKAVHTLEAHLKTIRCVGFSPDSKKFLTGSDDRHIHLYDTETGTKLGSLSGHGSWVLGAKYSPDGRYFASCSSDNTVKIWDANNRENLLTLQQHTDNVWGIDWNNDGSKLVSVGSDRRIIVFKCLS